VGSHTENEVTETSGKRRKGLWAVKKEKKIERVEEERRKERKEKKGTG
jgi:hypothetical protein